MADAFPVQNGLKVGVFYRHCFSPLFRIRYQESPRKLGKIEIE
jgi:hypothetical protein